MSGASVRLSGRDGHARAAQFSRWRYFVVNQTVHHVVRAAGKQHGAEFKIERPIAGGSGREFDEGAGRRKRDGLE